VDLLFLTQTYPRFAADTAGPFIRELARALVRAGDSVRVLVPHAAGVRDAWDDDGVEVIAFRYAPVAFEVLGYGRSLAADERVRLRAGAAAPLYLLGARRALEREQRRRPADLVQAHWLVPNAIAAVGPVSAQRRRRAAAFAVGVHGSDVFLAERRLARPLVRRALADCDVLTGCSGELVARACALGLPPERSRVIPYGVDVATFAPDPARRIAWRRRLGIPDDAPLLLGLGRMATKKGFQVLVPELAALLAAVPAAHVVLAGDGDLLAPLRHAAVPLAGRVHFPGTVYRDALPDLFRAADVFTLPAVHDGKGNVDGLPNVILEAMASGLPVVATAVSGIPLAVRDGQEGLLVAEGDGAALRQALADLLADPERARALGAAARARAVAELTWEAVAARYREAYAAGLAHAATRPAAR
jgi:glycosyltransferase involved in cell wall biosynthesis